MSRRECLRGRGGRAGLYGGGGRIVRIHVWGEPSRGRELVGGGPVFGVVVDTRVVDDEAAGGGEGVCGCCGNRVAGGGVFGW